MDVDLQNDVEFRNSISNKETMNNISIKCLKSEKIQSGACHGQFVINSLRPGQGITIGNQLRRVLVR
jgi:DNA-directed RNA polymerase alpha subunit